MNIQKNIKLDFLTSWLMGGAAEHFCQPETESELEQCLLWAADNKINYTVLGGGSNVLISDQGISGLVISMRKYSEVSIQESETEITLNCLAGTTKSEILKVFLKYRLPAALFLAGLPGDVGGGVVMNAGVSENITPREFGEIVRSFEVWNVSDHKIYKKRVTHEQILWSYRHASGWEPGIIAQVELVCPNNPDPLVLEKVRVANRERLQKQPLDKPSCGSVFKNPPGHKAAQLIEACGLKGMQIGQAQVSVKHANFIVNLGGATALDTWNLVLHVQKTVEQQRQIKLSTEVIRLGIWNS